MILEYITKYVDAHRVSSPSLLILFVTNKCNARCKHCFFWKNMKKKVEEPSLEQLEKIARTVNPRTLIITGGEPFLRDDIPEICEIFSNVENVFIATNGSFPEKTKKCAKRTANIRKNKSTTIYVSLDGLKKTHNFIRGIDVFDSAVKTIKNIKNTDGIDVRVLTTVTNKNYGEIEKLSEFVYKDLGVNHLFNILRGKPRDSSFIPPKEMGKLFKIFKNTYEKRGFALNKLEKERLKYNIDVATGKRRKKLFRCLAGRTTGVIYPNGDVAICEATKPVGNLKETDFNFQKIWHSKEADKRREEMKNCFCTHNCFVVPSTLYSISFILRSFLEKNEEFS